MKYRKYVKKYWYYFILGPLFLTLEAIGEFILPFISSNIINTGIANGNKEYIYQMGLIMVLIAIGMLITGVVGAYFAIHGACYVARDIRSDAYKRVVEFSFTNIDDFTSASLITRITNDVNQIEEFIQMMLRGGFRSPVMLIGAIVMSFMLNSNVAIVIVGALPILAFFIFLITMISLPRYRKMQEAIDDLNTNVKEVSTNSRVIKSFVRDDLEKEKFDNVNSNLCNKSVRALKTMLWLEPITTIILNATTILVLYYGGISVMQGNMNIGNLTAFITYLTQILNALNFLANIVLKGTRAKASSKRIKEIFNAKIDIVSKDNSIKVNNFDIEFKDVCYKYFKYNSNYVLKDISFKINEGEKIGIIGQTGCGKSTLISLIDRLYDTDSGNVLIGGVDIKDIDLEYLRLNISMVLQKNILFSGSIKDNLVWGKEDAKDEEILKAINISQASQFINEMNGGLDYFIEEQGRNLSGGQKQRICIARALIKDPKILILDDSLSAVDMATERKILKGFKENLDKKTVLIIAQRISSIKDCDKILVLENGMVKGFDSHKNLMTYCNEYKEIALSQNVGD